MSVYDHGQSGRNNARRCHIAQPRRHRQHHVAPAVPGAGRGRHAGSRPVFGHVHPRRWRTGTDAAVRVPRGAGGDRDAVVVDDLQAGRKAARVHHGVHHLPRGRCRPVLRAQPAGRRRLRVGRPGGRGVRRHADVPARDASRLRGRGRRGQGGKAFFKQLDRLEVAGLALVDRAVMAERPHDDYDQGAAVALRGDADAVTGALGVAGLEAIHARDPAEDSRLRQVRMNDVRATCAVPCSHCRSTGMWGKATHG